MDTLPYAPLTTEALRAAQDRADFDVASHMRVAAEHAAAGDAEYRDRHVAEALRIADESRRILDALIARYDAEDAS